MSGARAKVKRHHLIGRRFDVMPPVMAVRRILNAARVGDAGYVCFANVHMTVESIDSPELASAMHHAALVLADGRPISLGFRVQGIPAWQVRGPSTADALCRMAAILGIPIALYGGKPEVIASLVATLPQRYPALSIAYAWSPPFRPLTEDELEVEAVRIIQSGARMVFVGLGCPRQELWMMKMQSRLPMPLLGVGAWFDFAAGLVEEAPAWMRSAGLEWIFRLVQEPRRLFHRYARTNPRFCWLFLRGYARRAWLNQRRWLDATTQRHPSPCSQSSLGMHTPARRSL